jgi:hypothetical protein
MRCQAFRNEIEEGRDARDQLSGAAREHASLCDACARFRRESASLRMLVGGLGRVGAPDDFEYRLRARMRSGRGTPRGGLLAGLYTLRAAGAVAACLILAVAAVVYLRRPEPSAAPTVATQPAGGAGRVVESASANANGAADTNAAEPSREAETVAAGSAGGRRVDEDDAGERRAGQVINATPAGFERAGERAVRRSGATPARGASAGTGRRELVAQANQPVPVRLPQSNQPLRVVLRDESGAERVVSMQTVSFGSQALAGRSNFAPRGSAAPKEGVW